MNWILMLILIINIIPKVFGQNINTANKLGPMGTQVNTLTGNLYLQRNDLDISSRIDLRISFSYNSYNQNSNQGFGNGWSFNYGMYYNTDTANNVIIVWGDGREDTYKPSTGNSFISPSGNFNTLTQYQIGKYLLQTKYGIKYYFDNAGHKHLTKLSDPNGNYITFNYSGNNLNSASTSSGQSIYFNYNSNNLLTSLVDSITTPTRTFNYQYDSYNNLTQVTDPLGNKNKYAYLINGPINAITDKNNNIVDIVYYSDYSVSELVGCNKRQSFSYDTTTKTTIATDYLNTGNQVTTYGFKKYGTKSWLSSLTSNCCGYNMKFEFDANGNKTKETDANGNITIYTYDSRGNVLTITDALNQILSYTYSSDFNNVSSFTDAKGFKTSFLFDLNGNLIQLKLPDNSIYSATYGTNGDILTITDPKGNIFTYNYDSFGNPSSISAPSGYHANLSFDARGNLLSFIDSRGSTKNFEYDILDRISKIKDPLGNTNQLQYDAQGNNIGYLNENNEHASFKYDASNRLVQYTDILNNKSFLTYDAMDNVINAKNALGNSFSFAYDSRNRLSSIQNPIGNTSNLSYDANGNINAINLPNGENILYSHDELNRTKVINDEKGTILNLQYDKNGNILSYTNAAGSTTLVVYDTLDRIKKSIDPLGNATSYLYDKNSNILSVTDKNNNVKNYTYDSLNRLKTYTDNNGSVIAITYDSEGNIVTLKDQNNNITNYTYDSLNRLQKTIYPNNTFVEYSYNKKGNIISKKLTDGTNISFLYDSLNRLTSRILPSGQAYSYVYDALGRVITATNNSGTIAIAYDELNRVASETFDGRTVKYNYSITGRTQTIIYPDSTIVTKTFDTRNNLLSISKNNTTLISYQYNGLNQAVGKTFGNGITSTIQYDVANRLNNYNTGNGSVQNTSLGYDNMYNKTTITHLNDLSKSEQFNYDNGYRITNYKRGVIGGLPAIQNSYTYDALGNRTSANLNGVNNSYAINNLNQITSTNNGSQNINFTFDLNGNLTFDGMYYKKYDSETKLIKDSASPTNTIVYAYDAFGRRVNKMVNGVPLKYTYAGLQQIEERDGITNHINNRTIYNHFLTPVTNEKNGSLFFYHQNYLNSVEAITNAQGRLVEKYEYDVYGKLSRYDSLGNSMPATVSGNRFGFTGQEYDSATSSYNFHFRNYNPSIGVFNQRDPIGYNDGLGMYQYVHDNPANGIDILGLELGDEPIQDGLNLANGAGTVTDVNNSEQIAKLEQGVQNKLLDIFSKAKNSKQGRQKAAEEAAKFLENTAPKLNKLKVLNKLLGKLNPAVNSADLAYKLYKLNRALHPCPGDKPVTELELIKLQKDVALAAGGYNPVVGTYNLIDYAFELTIGTSLTDIEINTGYGINNYLDNHPTAEKISYLTPIGWARGLGSALGTLSTYVY